MNYLKENWKLFAVGVISGIIGIMLLGFNVWGWKSHGAALQQAGRAVEAALTENNVSICVWQAQEHDIETIRSELKEMSSYKRIDYVRKQSWAAVPGQEPSDVTRDVADLCIKEILEKGE